MTKCKRILSLLLSCSFCRTLTGCETDTPTSAVVVNAYPTVEAEPSQDTVVFKVWYSTTLFLDPVPSGQESDPERIVPSTDFAYALIAVGWEPSSAPKPDTIMALRSSDRLSVARGDALSITVSDALFVGDCRAGKPLAQEEADFITQRIFPGDFASTPYDAMTCTLQR